MDTSKNTSAQSQTPTDLQSGRSSCAYHHSTSHSAFDTLEFTGVTIVPKPHVAQQWSIKSRCLTIEEAPPPVWWLWRNKQKKNTHLPDAASVDISPTRFPAAGWFGWLSEGRRSSKGKSGNTDPPLEECLTSSYSTQVDSVRPDSARCYLLK